MSSEAATSAISSISWRVYTAPVGLPGLLKMTIFVQGVMFFSNNSFVSFQPCFSSVCTKRGTAPANRTISG